MKKLTAIILAFVFCFGCVAVYAVFGEGQLHVHASGDIDDGPSQPGTSTIIELPSILIRYSDGTDGPIFDFTNKTVTLKILVKDMDNARCREGIMTIKYDPEVFDFTSISGTFMGVETWQTDVFTQVNNNGLLTLSVRRDSAEPYAVGSEIVLRFSFARINVSAMSDHDRTFDLEYTFAGSRYKEDEIVKTKSFPVTVCPHNTADREVKDVPANCYEYSHRDTVCKMCGTVLQSVVTGNTYTDHIYDYENILRYVYANSYTDCDPLRTHHIVAEVKCQVCNQLQWADDLEFHINLDTSVKKYDALSNLYYYTCSKNHKVAARIQSPGTSTSGGSHEHTFGDAVVTKQPTCTEAGEQKRTCSICNEVKIETIPATGHKYGEATVIKQPTCTEAGESVRTCSVCGNRDTPEIVPALGHDFDSGLVTVITPATCSTAGVAVEQCARCGTEVTKTLPISPSAHEYGEWVTTTAGTCVTKEVRTRTCEYCHAVETQEFDYGAHDYRSEITTAPTCYEDGLKTYTCVHCGDIYEETVKCPGHRFGNETSDGKGTTTKVCTECGMTVSTTATSKKTTVSVSHGPFTLTVTDPSTVLKNIELRVTAIDRASSEYASNSMFLNALNAAIGKNYSIQNSYHVTLYVDGVESKITDDMTLQLSLDSALEKSKTAIVYYTESGSSTMITNMSEASRRKLVVTMPGKALAKAANDTVLLVVEGSTVTPSGTTPVTPTPPSGNNGSIVLPIVIVAVAIVVALTLAIVVIKGGKKNKFDF